MGRVSVATSLGEIWLWGPLDELTADKPVVLGVLGAFASLQVQMAGLSAAIPEASVYRMALPGQGCPAIQDVSIEGMAAALDEAVRAAFAGRRLVACGASVGGLIAAALRSSGVARLALDPPVRPEKAWPVFPMLRKVWNETPEHRPFLSAVFGLTETGFEPRDHLGVFTEPCWVIVGGEPLLPERNVDRMPSLLDEADRQALATNPNVRLKVIPGAGHFVAQAAPLAIVGAIRELLAG